MRDSGVEGVAAGARKVEAVPCKKDVGECNLDHAVGRSWRPFGVRGRAEAYGAGEREVRREMCQQ